MWKGGFNLKKMISCLLIITVIILIIGVWIGSNKTVINEENPGDDLESRYEESANFIVDYIDFFLDRRTSALVSGDFANADNFETDRKVLDVLESEDLASHEKSVLEELHERRSVLYDNGVIYTDFENEINVLSVDFSNESMSVTVEEDCKLYYKQSEGDEPEYTSWVLERVFIFSMIDSRWVCMSQELVNDMVAPPNEPHGVEKDEKKCIGSICI